jgi:hypothetical protein
MKAAGTEEEEDLAAGDAVEAEAEVAVEVAAVAAMSRVLLMIRAHRSPDSERRLTRGRVRTITARLNVTRRWQEVDSPGDSEIIKNVRVNAEQLHERFALQHNNVLKRSVAYCSFATTSRVASKPSNGT